MTTPEATAAIQAAYDEVRSDSSPTNWLVVSYASAKGAAMELSKTGEGGLAAAAAELDPAQAQYAYVRVEYANDTESRRVKFVFVVWIGPGTAVMRKARVGFEAAEMRKLLPHHSFQVDATDRADLDEDVIVTRLRKAGGADYNGGRG